MREAVATRVTSTNQFLRFIRLHTKVKARGDPSLLQSMPYCFNSISSYCCLSHILHSICRVLYVYLKEILFSFWFFSNTKTISGVRRKSQ